MIILETIIAAWVVTTIGFILGWYLRGRSALHESDPFPPCNCEVPDWRFFGGRLWHGRTCSEIWRCRGCDARAKVDYEMASTRIRRIFPYEPTLSPDPE